MAIWEWIFKTGLLGFLVALIVGGITAVNTVTGLGLPLFVEGGAVSESLTKAGLAVFLGASLMLWVPTLRTEIAQNKDRDRVDKAIWIVSLLLLPFVATYLYFRKYCR